jgi:integrase/recombinase XerD
MKLINVIDAYVMLQRSLRMRFEAAARLLRQFKREMGEPHINKVRREAVVEFLNGKGPLSSTWALKYRVLSGLYRFSISRGYVESSPLPQRAGAATPANTLCILGRRTASVT